MLAAAARQRLKKIYSAEEYRRSWNQAGEKAALLLESVTTRERKPLEWVSPADATVLAKSLLQDLPAESSALTDSRFALSVNTFLAGVNALQSPFCLGHQVAPPIPMAAVFEGLGATFNQGSGVFEVGPGSNGAERALVEALGERIGWGQDASGFFTHGGSAANMTAVAAARAHRFPNAWDQGIGALSERPCILVSEQAHYSIGRAAAILGLGVDNVLKVPSDSKRLMQPEAVQAVFQRAVQEGRTPFLLVASCGTTSVGAFDPLDQLAKLASGLGLWMHVDGAHGASVLFSETHRSLAAGIDRADSVTWDMHKMMYAPALSTALLFKDRRRSFLAFNQDAPYLFSPGSDLGTDGAERTFECTRRALALATWGVWSVYGAQVFSDLIDVTFATTHKFYEMLGAASDFEPLHQPQANILCFRYLPAGDRQSDLREALVRRGKFYLTRSQLDGQAVLRVTIMNPLTEVSDLQLFLEEIRATAASL